VPRRRRPCGFYKDMILILDCQASGANPVKGHLIEIAWAVVDTSQAANIDETSVQSYLVRLPDNVEVPRQVTRVTGLKAEDLAEGLSEEVVWKKLLVVAKELVSHGPGGRCPTIIHFARYEESFLHHMHQQYSSDVEFPFDIICTFQLSRRLLPQLPSKGLRAIAGYFGHSASQLRRASHHISATAFIWYHLVKLLADQGLANFQEYQHWLSKPAPPATDRQFPMPRERRAKLPDQPGVYRMLRSNGDLLYIGKATSLKKRVNSYFHKKKRSAQARLTMEMLTQAVDLEVTVTGSALEAALLETDEIKRQSPPYNVALQKGERQIVFYSKDLRQVSDTPGKDFPIGPLPSVVALSAFSTIHQLLAGEIDSDTLEDDELPAILLGMREEYAPPLDCFIEGVKLFKEQYPQLIASYKESGIDIGINPLMTLGKELRRKKLEEMALAELEAKESIEEEIEAEGLNQEEEKIWTPEAVVHVMEGIVRYGSHVIRRGRWFCLLSESVLTWTSGKTSGNQPRTLLIKKGLPNPANSEDVETNLVFVHSLDRQQCFDVVTYDRMRVLTTEMRRLVLDKVDRHVQLQLGPKVVLGSQQLHELFCWV
jgi:DNA polymerase III subunit epsilon